MLYRVMLWGGQIRTVRKGWLLPTHPAQDTGWVQLVRNGWPVVTWEACTLPWSSTHWK